MKKVFFGIIIALCFTSISYAQNPALNMTDIFKVKVEADKVLTFGISGKFFYELNATNGAFERLDTGKELTKAGLIPIAVARTTSFDKEARILLIFKDNDNRVYQASYYYDKGYTTWNGF